MNKLNFLVLFLPFIFTFFYSLTFLILQQISDKKYLSKLIYSFLFLLLLKIILIIKFYNFFNIQEIFYILFAFTCNCFIFMNLIQVPISSLQVKLLRMVSKNKGIKEKKINSLYDSNRIFEERLKTFVNNGTVKKKNSLIKLNSKKILIFYVFFKFVKALHNVRL